MKPTTRVSIATIILSLLFVTGCAKKTGQKIRLDPATIATRAESPVSIVETTFNPEHERYTLECRNPGDCPQATGLLVAFAPIPGRQGRFVAFNCTGNLIAPDKVLTNYHCVREQNLRILFQLPDGTRRVGLRVIRGQSPPMATASDGRLTVGEGVSADFAIVQLTQPITNVRPLAQAPEIGNPEYLRALVVNQKTPDSTREFIVDSLKCRFKTGFWWFPFATSPLATSPESYPVLGCPIFNGNSGGALVLDSNRNSLVGIVHGFHPNAERENALTEASLSPEDEFRARMTGHLQDVSSFNRNQSESLVGAAQLTESPSLFVGWFTATGCFDLSSEQSQPSRCQSIGEDELLNIRVDRFQQRLGNRTASIVNRWIRDQEEAVAGHPYRYTVEVDSIGEFSPFRLADHIQTAKESMRFLVPSCIIRGTQDLNRTIGLTALHTTVGYQDFLELDLVRQTHAATMTVRKKSDLGEQGAVLEISYRTLGDSVPSQLKDAFPREYSTPYCQQ